MYVSHVRITCTFAHSYPIIEGVRSHRRRFLSAKLCLLVYLSQAQETAEDNVSRQVSLARTLILNLILTLTP